MKKVCYLAGAMESKGDAGLKWRREYQKILKDLDISCIIPNDEEDNIIKNLNIKELKKTDIKELKKTDINKYIKIIREFIKQDLKFIDNSDMVIVKWNGERSSGTFHEVGHAYEIGKPTYLVSSLSNENILGWFLACFTKRFYNLNELVRYLKDNNET